MNFIDVYNLNIDRTNEKYTISLDKFKSLEDFKYLIENVYKVDYSTIEKIMNEYKELRLCDFQIEFNHYLIIFIINEKMNTDKYKSERLYRNNSIYKSFEIDYCQDYVLRMNNLTENQKLYNELELNDDIDDYELDNLIKKHLKKELTYDEVIEIVKNKDIL